MSLSNFLVTLLVLLQQGLVARAETVTFDWNITWLTTNPDGQADRPTIGINGQWPLPVLNFTKGDRIVANVHNQLGNQSTSMHFHGFFQNGTTEMDGPQGVTQCGIAPNSTMTYNFTVRNLYNSHALNSSWRLTLVSRWNNLALTGITLTLELNIPTA